MSPTSYQTAPPRGTERRRLSSPDAVASRTPNNLLPAACISPSRLASFRLRFGADEAFPPLSLSLAEQRRRPRGGVAGLCREVPRRAQRLPHLHCRRLTRDDLL